MPWMWTFCRPAGAVRRLRATASKRLERLARYAGRPPLATERLSLLPDGRLLYRLKRRWRDGTTHVIYEPLELVERLAALVPLPRFNLTRYSRVLAPGAAFRPLVVPQVEVSAPLLHAGCQGRIATTKTESGKARQKGGGPTQKLLMGSNDDERQPILPILKLSRPVVTIPSFQYPRASGRHL